MDKTRQSDIAPTPAAPVFKEPDWEGHFRIIQIPGIDRKKVLSIYSDNTDIYLTVLRSYATNMPAITESLRIVTEENLHTYAINVHGLKGSSGSIGATEIMEKAARMEAAAKAGDFAKVLAENGKLLEEEKALEVAIEAWLRVNDTLNGKPHQPTPDPVLLNRLRECCEQYDMNEVDEIMDELESFYYDNDNDLIIWLREKINLSDFTSVAECISPKT
jgi:HPt (histidine-containing phosphotransfer) domain-containing protein